MNLNIFPNYYKNKKRKYRNINRVRLKLLLFNLLRWSCDCNENRILHKQEEPNKTHFGIELNANEKQKVFFTVRSKRNSIIRNYWVSWNWLFFFSFGLFIVQSAFLMLLCFVCVLQCYSILYEFRRNKFLSFSWELMHSTYSIFNVSKWLRMCVPFRPPLRIVLIDSKIRYKGLDDTW